MKWRTRRTNIIPIPDVQDYHKAKSTQNPMTCKLFHTPMLLLILYTSAHPKPLERPDSPISMKLQSNSPYHTVEKQIETCFREQHMLPTEDGLTIDVRTNIHRYKTHKETNICLKIINEYQKTIEQYYAINNES